MLANVQQATIRPIIEASVAKGARVHTGEYDVYARLEEWATDTRPSVMDAASMLATRTAGSCPRAWCRSVIGS